MKSPFTGGEVTLNHERRCAVFRKEQFSYEHRYYHCVDTGEDFTTTQLDEVNTSQVYNQYRVKHGIPFADEIKAIRTKYGFSASKMSRILGFGDNTYRLYENGDMPSVANGKTLMAIKDISVFLKYANDAGEDFTSADNDRITKLRQTENPMRDYQLSLVFGNMPRGAENGYTEQSVSKLKNVMLFYIEKMGGVFVTKMNKLLFYSDFIAYREYGQAITGLSYKAIQYGPVPLKWDKVYSITDDIEQEIVEFKNGNCGQKLVSEISFDAASLTKEQIEVLSTVYQKFKACDANEISRISHKEDAWKENQKNRQIINFNYAFSLKAF